MIIGKLEELSLYKGISKGIDAAIDYIIGNRLSDGKTEIGDGIFYTLSKCKTKPAEEGKFEYHKKYIDLQIITEGMEYLGICDSIPDNQDNFSTDSDIGFFEAEGSMIKMTEGSFYLLMPQEAHMPCINDSEEYVKKAVFKIPSEN